MEDKEVGELWRVVRDGRTWRDGHICNLIRKLVEERTKYKHSRCVAQHVHYMTDSHFEQTLRDFGIPEETWKIKK